MKVEEAIKMALEYEGRVHALYLEAVKAATDDAGRRVFTVLAEEERGHLKHLNGCLDEWQKSGKITAEEMGTVIPPRQEIEVGVEMLKERFEPKPGRYQVELEFLQRALQVETETSQFYRRMVNEVDAEGQELFRRFMEIEEGHVAIVQAEIDAVSGHGHWFDHKEFDLEGA